MLRTPVSLSHTAYEVLWERADLGVMPAAISITYPLRTLDNGARMARETLAELSRAGLARDEDVHPDLVATLRALATSRHRYYGLYISEASPKGKGPFLAMNGRVGVLAHLDARSLHLRPVPADRALATLVAALPANRPGSGRSLSFRADELGADGRPVRPAVDDGGVLVAARSARGDADRYAQLMSTPRTAMIYLYAVRDGHQCGHPMIALDVDGDGRWLTSKQPGAGGIEWITATPATPATLAEQLATLR